jgi:hypothetical protein
MSRTLITFFFTYVITRLFFGISGFNPIRDLPPVSGYLIDFGIWALVFCIVYWFLGVLRIGTSSRKNGPIKE